MNQKRKWQMVALVCLVVTVFSVLYTQNIIFPFASQENVNLFWISATTDFLVMGIVAFVAVYVIKKKKRH